jgi:dipeptidyl aminopeptidase/acylaminoacyl peptidase
MTEGSLPRILTALVLGGLLVMPPSPVDAQYFGRNKVQYDDFDFRVLTTPRFDIYFYPEQEEVMRDVSRMAERWYERLARVFQHELDGRKPLIFYADHPDFQQTNTITSMVGEGTGGVTEGLKNRVIMPLAGSYGATDHVLGHELVHQFQFNVAQTHQGGLQTLMRLPLWMVEGMAEYLSVGRDDPLTGMWLRDAILREDFPTLVQLTRDPRFFPYRFGQAFWSYVGGTWGDDTGMALFRASLRMGWEPGIRQVLGIHPDTLSVRWKREVEAHYRPLMEGRTPPAEVGTLLLAPSTGAGHQNVAPAISPDGRRLVFISEKDLFTFDLYLADARTGEVLRKLSSASHDPHMDALRFIDSSGAWSPDGSRLAFVVFAGGRNEIRIVDGERGQMLSRLTVEPWLGEITGPSWSQDGGQLVFSGQSGGTTNLFLIDVATGEVTRLTDDRHAVMHPVFSPDGRTIAFSTDRGPETDFDRLTYSEMRLALYHMESGEVEVLDLLGNVKHINPQFTPDGRGLYFISDADGFSDIYRLELASGEIQRVTRVATGVSGISARSPAMSVARETGTVVFSVFDQFQFHIYSMDSRSAPEERILAEELDPVGRGLPPRDPRVPSRVLAYLADPHTALPPPGTFDPATAREYDSSLSLDYVGQPTIGVGTDQFGNFVAGSAAAFFSDMLGNRFLGVAFQAQGTLKDLGGQFLYQNRERRWNWGFAGGRIPNLFLRSGFGIREDGSGVVLQERLRIFQSQAMGMAAYPFSTTRRVEFTSGVTRYSFDLERELFVFDPFGRLVERRRENVSDELPDPLNLAQASVALVGDNSFMGFTGPIRGSRYRIEAGVTTGTLNFNTLTLDYRRYFNPTTELTFAIRGMHFGRYGSDVHGSVLQPIFLGWENFIRGYSPFSFEPARECSAGNGLGCPELQRLMGQRVGVVNAEVRIPLLGVERLGLLNFGFIPTDLILFTDAGLAWDDQREPTLKWSRTSPDRIPVFASGASARMNLMGLMIMEFYYAYPWQRPHKGWHWGFQIAPGW